MNLEECYNSIGGDYQMVMQRFLSEERVKRFLKMFLEDPNFKLLSSSLSEQNYKDAFRAAHTLKGVCLNLDLKNLLDICAVLTENLRAGEPDEATNGYVDEVKQIYEQTADTIRVYLDQETK